MVSHDGGIDAGDAGVRFRRAVTASIAMVSVLAALLTGTVLVGSASPAAAANGAAFDPGNIVSDTVFYDGYAMNSTEIQSFLTSKVPTCYSSYACLSTYSQRTPSMVADSYCAAYTGGAAESAALIISKVGRACGVSQKALLVLLEKEQGLVSMSNPTEGRFKSATGMGCPDTAPCDPNYSGFFYQVYYAARQYQIYAANPGWFGYRAGVVNSILYHPNPDLECGRKDVFIVNQATAGLYIYTPYTPNGAALSNLYGTGDACSSYGNRNFWRIFSDWFGSPTAGSSLVRTQANASVYLLAGNGKYSVPSMALLSAYSKLGAVGYVSQAFLDSYGTIGRASLVVRTPDGTIGLLDSGVIRPMTSCTVAEHFGGSCDPSGYTQLTDYQASTFAIGPRVQTYLSDAAGQRYVMRDGGKREVLDNESLAAFGSVGSFVAVKDSTIAALATGDPIVRDSVFVASRETGTSALLADGAVHELEPDAPARLGVPERVVGSLASTSLARLPQSGVQFGGVVLAPDGVRVLSAAGVVRWDPAIAQPVQPPVVVSEDLIASYPESGVLIGAGSVVTGIAASRNYLVTSSTMRYFSSTAAWDSLGDSVSHTAVKLPNEIIRYFPKGSAVRPVATQIKVDGAKSIFVIDGLDRKVQTPSLTLTKELGISGYATVSAASVSSYPTAPGMLTYGITCGAVSGVAAGGQLRPIPDPISDDYPIDFTELSAETCARVTLGADMTTFIRINNRSIFLIQDGVKHQVMSMARYSELRGTSTYVNVSTQFADIFETGPAA